MRSADILIVCTDPNKIEAMGTPTPFRICILMKALRTSESFNPLPIAVTETPLELSFAKQEDESVNLNA